MSDLQFGPGVNNQNDPSAYATSSSGGTSGTKEVFGDGIQDSVEVNEHIQDGSIKTFGQLAAYLSGASLPKLPKPNEKLAKGAFHPPDHLSHKKGDSTYQAAVIAFRAPGLTKEQGEAAYKEFLDRYPKDSPEYKALLKLISVNPKDPELPAAVKTFIDAREQLIKSLHPGLDLAAAALAAANKAAEVTTPPALGDEELKTLHKTVDDLKNTNGTLLTSLNTLPDSSAKNTMISYLKQIGDAIEGLITALFQAEVGNTDQLRERTSAKLDTTLAKVEELKKAMIKQIKAEHKEKSKAKLGIMSKILQAVVVLILVVVAVALFLLSYGGAAPMSAVLIMEAVDMSMKICGDKKGLWERSFELADTACEAFGDDIGMSDHDLSILKTTTKIILVCVVAAIIVCSPAIILGGSSAISDSLNATGLIKDPRIKMAIGMTLAVATMLIQLAVCVVIFAIFPPFGVAGIFGTITLFTNSAISLTLQAVGLLMAVAGIIMNTAAIVQGVNSVMMAKLKIEIARMQARVQSDVILKQSYIDMLKHLIEGLQAMLQKLTDTISGAQSGLSDIMKGASDDVNRLFMST